MRQIFVTAVLAGAVLGLGASGASARIRCEGEFQVSGGNRIATPYCEDQHLANVARTYGSRVSAEAIRNSVRMKQSVCQFIGSDIRVKSICDGYRREYWR